MYTIDINKWVINLSVYQKKNPSAQCTKKGQIFVVTPTQIEVPDSIPPIEQVIVPVKLHKVIADQIKKVQNILAAEIAKKIYNKINSST